MPPEEEDRPRESSERPAESGSEDVVVQMSIASQEKPRDLSEKDDQRGEMRKLGLTPSSVDLPKLDLGIGDSGNVIARIAGKSFDLGNIPPVRMPGGERNIVPGEGVYGPDGKIIDGEVPPVKVPGGERGARHEAPESGAMGRAGDRSQDSGLGKPTNREVTTDDQGRVTAYSLPDGTKYEFKYGEDGQADEPTSVTITPEKSSPMTFEHTKNGWHTADNQAELNFVSFDKDTKEITILGGGTRTKIRPDGSFEEKDESKNQITQKIDADGTAHAYEANGDERVAQPDSSISEIKSGDSVKGYEVRDDQGHLTKVELNDDGSATVTKGDLVISYDLVERTDNGDLKFTNDNKTSVEIRKDGTEIDRDKRGQITKITNSDGEVTEFKRSGGKVTGLTVTDGQGHVVERRNKGIEIDDTTGNYTIKLDKAEAETRKSESKAEVINEDGRKVDGGAETGTAERVERKADGTERLLDKDGKEVTSGADKLISHFRNYTPEQQRQLRQDLADIDKLPPEQRKEIYDSLEKIAHNDDHPGDKIRLNGQQARELVQSLAHQVAHPESIQQGDKMTCVLANAEQTMARQHPEVYADMISKLATEGKYTTQDGKTTEAQTGSDETTLAGKSDWYGQRSYSSELFQNAVANLGLPEGAKYESYPPGDPHLNPRPDDVDASSDTGERVTYPDGHVTRFEGLMADKQAEVLNHLIKDGNYTPQSMNTPAELEAACKDPPVNVGIALKGDRAQTGMGAGEGAALSGYHAVNITHYDKGPPAMVYYENPADGDDHSYPNGKGVPADEFIQAMHAGKTEMKAVVRKK